MKKKLLWLRNETKPFERRTSLTPEGVKALVSTGAEVRVEEFSERIFPLADYQNAGAKIVAPGSWIEAPADAIILGLKELPLETGPLKHRHIYFAHAYKGQEEAPELLTRFQAGGGKIYDLEFLMDENKRRVCAFGHWAGYVGAAISVKRFFMPESFPPLKTYENQAELLADIRSKITSTSKFPKTLVMGARGRCGKGALALLKDLNLVATEWDQEETKNGGPFKDILDHDIFVNTVLLQTKISPFLTLEMFNSDQLLKIIGDVSCDPNNPNNPIPLYSKITSWEKPFAVASHLGVNVEILAVDNLPSLLPRESSEDFAEQLLPHLIQFLKDESDPVWKGAEEIFHKTMNNLLPKN